MRVLPERGHEVIGLDVLESPFTSRIGSIADPACVRESVAGADAVINAATLHKPHIGSHSRLEFVETNIAGTLNLLEQAVAADISRFIFISTTSTFGRALQPAEGEPAAWITEEVKPVPRNIYGTTKNAAEDLCEVVHREHRLPCLVLKTSRFFPEADDRDEVRAQYESLNVKVNELLYRRVDIEDIVAAVELALQKAPEIGFRRYIISATTPFTPGDREAIRTDLPAVLRRLYPGHEAVYRERGWTMFPSIERVYDNERARQELGWEPRYGFKQAIDALAAGRDPRSELALAVGAKGYHAVSTGVYTVR